MFHKITSLRIAKVLSFSLLIILTQAKAATPHFLTGSVTIPGYGAPANGTVDFDCYLVDYPTDVLHISSTDCGYDNTTGLYWVQCGNFKNPWVAGMVIHLDIYDTSGGSASAEAVLTNEPADFLNVILLGSSLSPDYVKLNCKVLLDGGYQTGTDDMNTLLNDLSVIPLASPYSDSRTAASIPAGIVDWIYVELRAAPAAAPTASKSFFLKKDGVIVDIDGTTTNLQLDGASAGYYYVVVNHRNHMAVMSANTLFLSP